MISRIDIAILIACLGAGAVVAVPRHQMFARETRAAEVSALSFGAATAAQLAHTRWLAAGQPATIDGTRGVVAMVNGFPSPATLPLMLTESETLAFAYDSGVWRQRAVGVDQPCGVAYQPPPAPDQNPDIQARTSGC
ncbi:MAG: hypothetical protein R3F24_01905 [Gammaproteobacteria bacterium]